MLLGCLPRSDTHTGKGRGRGRTGRGGSPAPMGAAGPGREDRVRPPLGRSSSPREEVHTGRPFPWGTPLPGGYVPAERMAAGGPSSECSRRRAPGACWPGWPRRRAGEDPCWSAHHLFRGLGAAGHTASVLWPHVPWVEGGAPQASLVGDNRVF